MKKNLMKMTEAAAYLGVHKKTLDNWINAGRKITFYRDPVTRFRYFCKKDLDSFINGMKINEKETR